MNDHAITTSRGRLSDRSESRRPFRSTGIRIATTLTVIGLGGCIEQSDDLLGTAPLPALTASDETPLPVDSLEPSIGHADDADPWSRADWSPVVVAVPMASTVHQPTYVDRPLPAHGSTTGGRYTSPTAFPTAESALVVETDTGGVILSAVIAPVTAALDLVVAPVRMILCPPWTALEGPEGGWVLLPHSRTMAPGNGS